MCQTLLLVQMKCSFEWVHVVLCTDLLLLMASHRVAR